MDKRILPSPELLRQLLRYEPDTGRLYWRERPREFCSSDRSWKIWNTQFSGKEAFTALDGHGYPRGALLSRSYSAHRVAWAIFYGAWPEGEIDHINGRPTDNRIANLREANRVENLRNTKRRSDNASGFKGVTLCRPTGRWRAKIKTDMGQKHLGYFDTPEEAHAAYVTAAERRYGEFANYG